jgi:hypothetical protein
VSAGTWTGGESLGRDDAELWWACRALAWIAVVLVRSRAPAVTAREVRYRCYPSRILQHSNTTMASKRTVSVLRPALSGIGSCAARSRCASKLQSSPRTLCTQAARPRKLTPTTFQTVRNASSDSKSEPVAKTGLYDLHSKYGAKFVPFGGYSMPVQYNDLSIVDSHHWTREKASLFDVGHMYV